MWWLAWVARHRVGWVGESWILKTCIVYRAPAKTLPRSEKKNLISNIDNDGELWLPCVCMCSGGEIFAQPKSNQKPTLENVSISENHPSRMLSVSAEFSMEWTGVSVGGRGWIGIYIQMSRKMENKFLQDRKIPETICGRAWNPTRTSWRGCEWTRHLILRVENGNLVCKRWGLKKRFVSSIWPLLRRRCYGTFWDGWFAVTSFTPFFVFLRSPSALLCVQFSFFTSCEGSMEKRFSESTRERTTRESVHCAFDVAYHETLCPHTTAKRRWRNGKWLSDSH